jgi:hypothetical protein
MQYDSPGSRGQIVPELEDKSADMTIAKALLDSPLPRRVTPSGRTIPSDTDAD